MGGRHPLAALQLDGHPLGGHRQAVPIKGQPDKSGTGAVEDQEK